MFNRDHPQQKLQRNQGNLNFYNPKIISTHIGQTEVRLACLKAKPIVSIKKMFWSNLSSSVDDMARELVGNVPHQDLVDMATLYKTEIRVSLGDAFLKTLI